MTKTTADAEVECVAEALARATYERNSGKSGANRTMTEDWINLYRPSACAAIAALRKIGAMKEVEDV